VEPASGSEYASDPPKAGRKGDSVVKCDVGQHVVAGKNPSSYTQATRGKCTRRREPISITTKTKMARKQRSYACKKSTAQMSLAWLRRNVAHVCLVGTGARTWLMYFWRVAGHFLDECHDVISQRFSALLPLAPRPAPPTLSTEISMPAQQHIGLDDHQCRFPTWQFAGYENEQCAVTPGECGAYHLPLQYDELLTQDRVFKHQSRLAARQVQMPQRSSAFAS